MKTALVTALIVAASGAALGPTQACAQVNFNIIIGNPPPPPRYEVMPAPRPGYAWAPGYWTWNGHNHDWRAGHWERARDGEVYYQPRWVQAENGWRLQEGGWRRADGDRHHDRHDRYDDRRDEYRRDDHGGHGQRHGGGHCPPGQAKKGNC